MGCSEALWAGLWGHGDPSQCLVSPGGCRSDWDVPWGSVACPGLAGGVAHTQCFRLTPSCSAVRFH